MSPNTRRISAVALFLILLALFYRARSGTQLRTQLLRPLDGDSYAISNDAITSGIRPAFFPGVAKPAGSNYSRILVVPKTKDEDVGWIRDELPEVPAAVYEVDNPAARLRVPKNKGHEAMVYLTYIIDHYDEDLPNVIIFVHSHRGTWHNNFILDLDTPKTIKRLRDDRVTRQGYMNLRCHLDPGCPNWIHLDRAEVDYDMVIKPEEKAFSPELFIELFPGHRPPPVLSQPCCAQFAVSSERVRDNPKALYEHLRNWLLETSLPDTDSGRIFEYTWQYLFTRNAEVCPSTNACYCDGYGICFGGAVNLEEFLKTLKKKEGVEDELDAAQKEGKGEGVLQEIRARKNMLDKELSELKEAAYKRGEDEANRAIERERLPNYPYVQA
ncbi:hypothetical protein K458DRAFT_422220 [Lentithecium fluviatile CBS 122367]|uniref:Uncharacterized protein n=1 Tax=Lentithecium fluviatile CBS 122367 TaxID=1168545 RepID=A0A6G1IMC9_9PLEO|nr:hypothetical protein K458DRAFT_422220 [Lentithecium fluviatile CBS 122367]